METRPQINNETHHNRETTPSETESSHAAVGASWERRRLVPSSDRGTPTGDLVKAVYAEDVSMCSSILDSHPELVNSNIRHYADRSALGPWWNDSGRPTSEPPLVMACMLPRYKGQRGPSPGCFSIAQLLVSRGAGLRAPGQMDNPHWANSILHRVCGEYNSAAMLDLLVRAGANPATRERDEYERTALQVAAESGAVDSVCFLLRHGANVDDPGLYGDPMSTTNTPLHTAAEWGRYKVLRVLLEHGGLVYLNSSRGDGLTPLQLAVGMGSRRISLQASERKATVTTLLDAGADATITGPDGVSLLRATVSWAGEEVIRWLVETGADLGERGLHCSEFSRWRPSGWVLEGGTTVTNLHIAASAWNEDGVRALVALGAEVDAIDSDGRSPLHWVAIGNFPEKNIYGRALWELSTELQADLESTSDAAVGPARFLLQHGSILDRQDRHGRAALHYAARNKYMGLVKLLLEQGANSCLQDSDGSTTLHMLAHFPLAALESLLRRALDDEFLNLLRQAGTQAGHLNIDYVDHRGDTPLHIAARYASDTAVDLFLRLGADPKRRNADGSTALHPAARRPLWQRQFEDQVLWRPFPEGDRRAKRMRSLLLAAGADASSTDADGHTAAEIESAEAERIHRTRELAEQKARRPLQPDYMIGRGRGGGARFG
ncbi:hypothetical protein NKR23_g1018 [Pleurostoma richardsiae]|uniref:Ankyrin n=1 Tax=Pleurostoma richardsiae TaxID=41990 RepID=A0AA38RTZ0_9PEZI|nr:hypothetical protein NKR23_g1018 [Pleurostoma richardsiae]